MTEKVKVTIVTDNVDAVVEGSLTSIGGLLMYVMDRSRRELILRRMQGIHEQMCSREDAERPHDLYKPGDPDAPAHITSRWGVVNRALCRRCGKEDRDLIGPCQPKEKDHG